jgi:diguanylate cyclase (GGDEF)-like protein/PAS domain S-box-containing protein
MAGVLDGCADAVLAADPRGRLLFANLSALNLFGLDPDRPGDHAARDLIADLPDLAADTQANDLERTVIHGDNAGLPVSVSIRPLSLPSGGVVLTCRNIDQRKRIEQAHQEQAQRLRTIIDNVSDVVYTLSLDGMFTFVSPTWTRILGHAPEEVTGRHFQDFVHPDHLPACMDYLQEVLESDGPVHEITYLIRRADGAWRWNASKANLVRDSRGTPLYIVGVGADIHDQVLAEEMLQKALERGQELESIIERGPVVVLVWLNEPGWPLEYVTQNVGQFGFDAASLLEGRQSWDDIIHPDDAGDVRQRLVENAELGVAEYTLTYRIITAYGHERWVEDRVRTISRDESGPLTFQSLVFDVTVRMEAELALRRTHDELEERVDERTRELAAAEKSLLEERGRLYNLLETLPAMVTLQDAEYNLTYANRYFREAFGNPEDGPCYRLFAGRDTPCPGCSSKRILASGQTLSHEFTAENGKVYEIHGHIFPDTDNTPLVLKLGFDVTAHKRALAQLEESEARFRAIVSDQTELICRFTSDGVITFANPALARYLGLEEDSLAGMSIYQKTYGLSRTRVESRLGRLDPANPVLTQEMEFPAPDGEMCWQQWTVRALFDPRGKVLGYQAVGRDVTEARRQKDRIRHLAMHDPLTNLPNRTLFMDRLKLAMRRSDRKRRLTALLYADLNDFKKVNDSLGHMAGDKTLKEAAQRIQNALRAMDTVARIGGDEFVVLLQDIENNLEIESVAWRIIKAFEADFNGIRLGVSLGIAIYPKDGRDTDTLLSKADKAMYTVKQAGSSAYAYVK